MRKACGVENAELKIRIIDQNSVLLAEKSF